MATVLIVLTRTSCSPTSKVEEIFWPIYTVIYSEICFSASDPSSFEEQGAAAVPDPDLLQCI